MLGGPKDLRPYHQVSGRVPFMDWLHGLRDSRTRAILRNRLERFAEGNPGHWRSVGQGVFELKIDCGPGYRIYFGWEGPHVIILLNGGDKKSQTQDIHEAQNFWQDYKERKYGTERQLP